MKTNRASYYSGRSFFISLVLSQCLLFCCLLSPAEGFVTKFIQPPHRLLSSSITSDQHLGKMSGSSISVSSDSKLFIKRNNNGHQDRISTEPLLLRAARGGKVERIPVWMMRQAGRHMEEYRQLVKKHPTFRERSETVDVATEISLQPWRRYRTDGVILFSDILTPLPGMNVKFNIKEGTGPDLPKLRSMAEVNSMTLMDPAKSTPFVGEILRNLRKEIGNEATLLGFLGLPFTLATYMIEGGGSEDFYNTKMLMYHNPEIVHALLKKLEDNMVVYGTYQIENGAQVLQVFDSWAATLSPRDYDEFALPYQRRVIERLKAAHPEVPIILYIAKSGALLEKMGTSGADIVSLDWTSELSEAKRRMAAAGAPSGLLTQGNLDPLILLSDKATIKERTEEILRQSSGSNHIMNLGHGIDPRTSEENVDFFIETVKNFVPS